MVLRKKVAAEKVAVIARLPLFAGCEPREIEDLAQLFDETTAEANEILMREGTVGREFFVVVEGAAAVTLRGERLATLMPGSFFGEMALLEVAPRMATVMAETPMRLLVLDRPRFEILVERFPAVASGLLRRLSARLRAAHNAPGAVTLD